MKTTKIVRNSVSLTADALRDIRNPNIAVEFSGTSAVGKSLGLPPGMYAKSGQRFIKVR